MAIAASGQVSTTNLESEFSGVTPSTKTMANYAGMCNSTGTDTSVFYSKTAPTASAPTEEMFPSPPEIYLQASVNGQGNSNCRFAIQIAEDANFTVNLDTSNFTTTSTSTVIHAMFETNAILIYARVVCEFGVTYSYVKYSSTFNYGI